jgi:hypothetical protein
LLAGLVQPNPRSAVYSVSFSVAVKPGQSLNVESCSPPLTGNFRLEQEVPAVLAEKGRMFLVPANR